MASYVTWYATKYATTYAKPHATRNTHIEQYATEERFAEKLLKKPLRLTEYKTDF